MLDNNIGFCYNIPMYIREFTKTNGTTKKKYKYLRLVENVRTENGPRQKIILNLGKLNIDKSQYPALAKRIEEILTGQSNFFQVSSEIEKIARDTAKTIFKKRSKELKVSSNSCYENVDISSIEAEYSRTIGAEYVCHSIWKELDLTPFLKEHSVSENHIPIIEALVVGRLINPGSEHKTKYWAENLSGLYEITGGPVRVNKNTYYHAGDALFNLKDELEKYLMEKEKNLFNLQEHIVLIDLTNSYFEGYCGSNPKATFGRSKEKRNDCRLMTLGLIVDELGFPKYSKLFGGNQAECETLEEMIKALELNIGENSQKTVVIDAGIATEKNIKWLNERGYKYIAVHRGDPIIDKDFNDMDVIKVDEEKGIRIEIKRYEDEKEVYILCHSILKERKEQSIRSRLEKIYVEKLEYYKNGLNKKSRVKSYRKLLELIGRLSEKYTKIAKHYVVEVIPEPGKNAQDKNLKAIDINWKKKESYEKEKREEGSYILRTNRRDLEDSEIWVIYIMLRRIEKAFLNMKSHLGLRPNFHQYAHRVEAHMFISVIAYHILNIIEYKMRLAGDKRSWATLREVLSSHTRITINYKTKDSDGSIRKRKIRITVTPEIEHVNIYRALNLNTIPLPRLCS